MLQVIGDHIGFWCIVTGALHAHCTGSGCCRSLPPRGSSSSTWQVCLFESKTLIEEFQQDGQSEKLKIQGKFPYTFLALEQDKEGHITEAVCCTRLLSCIVGIIPCSCTNIGAFIYELLRHGCRQVCMLHIKGLPGGNSGVQWLLALIPGSQAVSFALGPGKTAPHCTATAPLLAAGNNVCCPFLTSHTIGRKLPKLVATNISTWSNV